MAFNTLVDTSPSASFGQLLHIGTGNISTTAVVRLGDGTATPLSFVTGGIAVAGSIAADTISLGVMDISRAGSVARSVTLPDASGLIGVDLTAVLQIDMPNSTVTPVAVTALQLELEANSTYEFDGLLMCQSASAAVGIQPQLTGPAAQTDWVSYQFGAPKNTNLNANDESQWFSSFAQVMANAAAPAAATNFPLFLHGMLRTGSSTPILPLGISFQSKTGGTEVSVRAGSVMRCRKLI